MDLYFVGLIVFIVTLVLARQLNAKALNTLSEENKVKLVDEFATGNLKRYLPVIVVMVAFFAAMKNQLLPFELALALYFVLIIGYAIYNSIQLQKRLRALDFPQEYITMSRKASLIRLGGIAMFLVSLLTV